MKRIIGNREVQVGQVIKVTKGLFPMNRKLPSDPGWPNYRFLDSEIFEIKSLVTQVRGPHYDRESTQQSFELALNKGFLSGNLRDIYLRRICKYLGEPRDVEEEKVRGCGPNSEIQVQLAAKWSLDDIYISI